MKRKIIRYFIRGLMLLLLVIIPLIYYYPRLKVWLQNPSELWYQIKVTSGIGSFSFNFILSSSLIFLSAAFVDYLALGWKSCAFRRLFSMHSKSKSGDWWCWCLSIFNLYDFFSLFFSFGLFYVISSIIVKLGGFSLINLVPSVPLQFIIVFLLADLKHYLWHRFMHINPFWELHKYHHSATELNLITAFRGHFLEKGVGTIFDGILFSILGTPIVQFNTLQIGKQFYDQLIHSDINWSLGWVGRHILISPKTHKIHHSSQPEFYDKNFGTFFVFWELNSSYKCNF